MWQGLPIGPVFIGVLILLGTPWYMPLAAIVIFASMVALSLQEYKRIAGAAVVLPIKHIEVPRYPGEHIVVSIFGVMKTGTISTASLGVGQAANPENSLLLTNERMLWIQVPVSGAGMVIGDMDYTVQNMLFNRSELRQKGTEMLAKNTIEQILSEHIIRSLPYTMINSVEIKSYSILVACTDGTSLEYLIIDRDYLSTLQQSLKDIFKERYKESS